MRATTSSPLARRRGACALALPLAGVLWAAAPAAPREVAASRSGALVTSVAPLPGRLLAAAVARADGGRYGLALLVAGDIGPTADSHGGVPATSGPSGNPGGDAGPSAPRSVLFLDLGSSDLVTVVASVPGRVNALVALAAGPQPWAPVALSRSGEGIPACRPADLVLRPARSTSAVRRQARAQGAGLRRRRRRGSPASRRR